MGMRGARGRGCKTPHPSLNGMEMQEGKLARAACADCSLDTKTPGATVPGSVAKGNLRSSSCPRCSKAEAEGAWHSPAVLGEAVLMEQRPAVMNHSPGLRVWAALGWRCSALPLHPFLGLNNSTALQRVLQHSPCPRCSLSPPPQPVLPWPCTVPRGSAQDLFSTSPSVCVASLLVCLPYVLVDSHLSLTGPCVTCGQAVPSGCSAINAELFAL